MHTWFHVQLDQKIYDGIYCRFNGCIIAQREAAHFTITTITNEKKNGAAGDNFRFFLTKVGPNTKCPNVFFFNKIGNLVNR